VEVSEEVNRKGDRRRVAVADGLMDRETKRREKRTLADMRGRPTGQGGKR